MRTLYLIPFLFLVLIVFSCRQVTTPIPSDVQQILKDKVNRTEEIQRAIDKYAAPSDSLKRKALFFLLSSLQTYYYYDYDLIGKYYEYIKMVKREPNKGPFVFNALQEIYGPFTLSSGNIKRDLSHFNSENITENIDLAFQTRYTNYWAEEIPFDTFCNYVVPFRLDNEVPDYKSRAVIYGTYRNLLDSLSAQKAGIIEVAKVISRRLKNEGFLATNRLAFLPHISCGNLMNFRGGTCWNMSDLTTYVMRTAGIPCTYDYVIQWPTRNGAHSWNVIIDKNGKSIPFSAFGQSFEIYSSVLLKKGKVYRNTTLPQKESLALQKMKTDKVPPFFLNSRVKDVTEQYVKCFDIEVVLNEMKSSQKFAYLCVFNDHNWVPIHWGRVKNGRVAFTKMEGGIAYLPCFYREGKMIAASDPFVLDSTGHMVTLHAVESDNHLKVKQVCSLRPHFIKNSLLVGGVFEGAHSKLFNNPDTLYRIKNECQEGLTSLFINNKKKYRYVRFKSPENFEAQIAEVSFSAAEKLSGKIITSINRKFPGSCNTPEKAFDNNLSSYFQSRTTGAWVGLEFARPEMICSIAFAPAVKQDSSIMAIAGDTYMLTYWKDGGWKEAGKCIADSSGVVFKNAPQSALFCIQNITAVQRSRIFVFEKGNPVWY